MPFPRASQTKKWPPEEEAQVVELRGSLTNAQLAAHFGIGQRTMETKIRMMGLSRGLKTLTPEQRELVTQLYPVSGSRELAKLIPGFNAKYFCTYAARYGLHYAPWSEQEVNLLKELCAAGASYCAMSARFGRTRGAVYHMAVDVLKLDKPSARKPPKPKPEKVPKMKVVREQPVKAPKPPKPAPVPKAAKSDFRSQIKVPQGKKRTMTAFEGQQKLSDYLKGLPRHHEHQRIYEVLTRPGSPRHIMRTTEDFLTVAAEQGLLQHSLAA